MLLIILLAIVSLAIATHRGAFGERARVAFAAGSRPARIVGAIGFVLGFVGPVIVTPEANQGPMLGIFITGPLGFLLGFCWGFTRGWIAAGA